MGTRFATSMSPANRQPIIGVEWHANVYSMLKNNRTIHPIPKAITAIISALWVAVILIAIGLVKRDLAIPLLLAVLISGLFFPV